MTRDWSKEFNALPDDVRLIGRAMELRTRIQHLKAEKDRLLRLFKSGSNQIDDWMHNCIESLKELDDD